MCRSALGWLVCIWLLIVGSACAGGFDSASETPLPRPVCDKPAHTRMDAHTPEVQVADWSQPLPVVSLNTACPEDAIEISRDGMSLYFLFTVDLLDNLSPEQVIAAPNGTYRAARAEGLGDFTNPVLVNLGKGVDGSLDGELSFSPDGTIVYFHSLRPTNTGYRKDPAVEDFLDIYVADLVDGVPGAGRNLGYPVNTVYPDGEHSIHPDGLTLYFASPRTGGLGEDDIWSSRWDGASWSTPTNLGAPVNSMGNDLQPTFSADGNTMYFTSDRDPTTGMAIYGAEWLGERWGEPELVITGVVGEPSLTGDGTVLYFVHVLTDEAGVYDADIWYTRRVP